MLRMIVLDLVELMALALLLAVIALVTNAATGV